MEFRQGVLVDRELEIAYYLRHAFSMDRIVEKTGINRKILQGHVRNMREKLHAEDTAMLIKIIQSLPREEASELRPVGEPSFNAQIRATTITYFDSLDKRTGAVGNRNIILIAIALLFGIAAVLFVCDRLMVLFMTSDLTQELQGVFAR